MKANAGFVDFLIGAAFILALGTAHQLKVRQLQRIGANELHEHDDVPK